MSCIGNTSKFENTTSYIYIYIYIYIYNLEVLPIYSGVKKFLPPSCFNFFCMRHTWMIQIKQILILHKDNPSKYKMQFWNDFIY